MLFHASHTKGAARRSPASSNRRRRVPPTRGPGKTRNWICCMPERDWERRRGQKYRKTSTSVGYDTSVQHEADGQQQGRQCREEQLASRLNATSNTLFTVKLISCVFYNKQLHKH